jgi:hypothetical protein
MFLKRAVLFCAVLLCLSVASAPALHAQATTSGSVTGAVLDPAKAVVAGAQVTLARRDTNATLTTVTNTSGIYLFPSVPAGDYTLRCTVKGFRTTEIKDVHVEVLKAYTYDLSLELGVASETVEVATTGAELQTADASVGRVIGGDELLHLPALARSVTALMLLQPAVSPSICGSRCENGGNDTQGGGVAGALPDQTTFYVDGGDATSDLEGTNNYVAPPGEPQPAPFIAVPAETTQEFRVVTASPTSSFARSQGGEVAIITKSGTNTLHGSAYEYYYGSGLRANDWQLNSLNIHRPHSVNNRYGGSFGGPLLKDKLFFYGNYEARRFYSPFIISTVVPTDSARAGILRFRDNAGNTISYNFNLANGALASACGAGAGACDPRSIGISPLIQSYLKMLPEPNNATLGDGLNSSGFTAAYAKPVIEDLAVGKLDYNINARWSVFGTFHYNRYRLTTTDQFNVLTGSLLSSTPVEPRFVTFQLTGQVGSHFTTQTHGSFMRDWWGWNRAGLAPQLPGTSATLQLSGEARLATGAAGKVWADPINFNTQNARSRVWFGRDWFYAEDAAWLHGTHTFQFGGGYYFWDLIHSRTDVVTGGLTNGPIYWVGQTVSNGGSFLDIPASQRPPTCAAGGANCLRSADLSKWNVAYASLLGLMDRSSQVGTRDGNFIANPLGSPLLDHVHTHSFSTYFQDSWKVKPTFTLIYGVSYDVQFAPHELNGKQVMQVFAADNQPLSNLRAFFQQRNAALTSGGFFASGLTATTDATFGFSPIGHISGRTSSATTSYNNFGPRVAVAWQIPFKNRLFGSNQTVIRAGYSLLWNRVSGVGEVLTPLLGNGLASVDTCSGPTFNGTATASCSGNTIDASNGFRIGTDGNTVPIPPFTNAAIPLVGTSPFGVSRASISDPALTPPYSHLVSVDIQRSFARNWFVDVGYIGRFSRNLWTNVDVNAADPFAKDPTSGETLAQAFDAIAQQVRAGVNPANVTPQPFFENAPYGCPGCTVLAAKRDPTDLINGSLSGFMITNYDRRFAPRPLDPLQFVIDNLTTKGGWARYDGMFVSARKASPNWSMSTTYTWSHSLSNLGGFGNYIGQQYTFYSPPTPFDFNSGTASANGDHRQVFNQTWYYLLPFGRGQRFSTSSGALDRIIGGWYTSGVWTMETGLPTCVNANGNYGAPTGATCAVGALFGMAGRHNGVLGSNGIGTATSTGVNLFGDPATVYNSLTRPLISVNSHPVAENFNLPASWNVDTAVGKNLLFTERFRMTFSAEVFNLFNHPLFGTNFTPGSSALNLNNPAGFGVLSSASNAPRQMQLGLRFQF